MGKLLELEKGVCSFFGIDIKMLYEKYTTKDINIARSYIMYIAHYDYGISTNKLAMRYRRTRRNVFRFISNMKFYIENFKESRLEYTQIKKHIEI